MNQPNVEAKVKAVLADKLSMDIAKIKADSLLLEDLGMDSFGSIETVFELEEQFKIKISDADIEKAKTVKDIVAYIAGRVASPAEEEKA
ncbi:MAG: acyl carrier protein [Candidatus Omnitrophica bacterium]|nr:acyl carrier protein [Candidatus Omnitrophota bacterium]